MRRLTILTITIAALFLTADLNAQLAPGSDEIQANVYVTDEQVAPAVARLPKGGFVTVWQSRQDGSDTSIHARMVSGDGKSLSSEIAVNTVTTGTQAAPAVASDADGGFVVVWHSSTSNGTDQSFHSIQARRFSPSGQPLGPDFQVNSHTLDFQINPRIAMAPNGSFVVTWSSNTSAGDDDSQSSIQARRFAADGTPLGPDFQVNAATLHDQQRPAIAMAADGSFVIAWQSLLQDGWGDGIYAQRFGSDGLRVGPEFRVNAVTEGFQSLASLAIASDGRFMAAWESEKNGGSDLDVQARLFNAAGQPLTGEIQVNPSSEGFQSQPSVTWLSGEGFFVAWQSQGAPGPDSSGSGVVGRLFNNAGTPVGLPFQINATTADNQLQVALAATDGEVAAVWQSRQQDGDDYGIFGRWLVPATFFETFSK